MDLIILQQKQNEHSINITKKMCLSLHYNGSNSCFYANGVKMYQFKAKDYEIKVYRLFLSNISKDFTVNNMKKMG